LFTHTKAGAATLGSGLGSEAGRGLGAPSGGCCSRASPIRRPESAGWSLGIGRRLSSANVVCRKSSLVAIEEVFTYR